MIEQLNPDNPEEYQTPDGWKPFETRRSIMTVKDAPPVTLTLRWTENGPVLPGSHYDLAHDHARPAMSPRCHGRRCQRRRHHDDGGHAPDAGQDRWPTGWRRASCSSPPRRT